MAKLSTVPPRQYSRSDIVNLAVHTKYGGGTIEDFMGQVRWLRTNGMLSMSDEQVQLILDEYSFTIWGQIAERLDYEESLPEKQPVGYELGEAAERARRTVTWQLKDFGPPLEALLKGGELLKTVATRYGWKFDKTSKSHRWVHEELQLVVFPQKRGPPVLYVSDSKPPCIRYVPGVEHKITADLLASYMMSALFDPAFIEHIAHWDPTYPERLCKFHAQKEVL